MAQEQQLSSPSVQQAPLPGVKVEDNAPIGAFGGGAPTSEAFGAATDLANTSADAFYKRAQRQKELQDVKTNIGLAGQVSELQSSLLYDPQKGAIYQHGQNADGIHDRTMEAWNKGVSNIANGISDPRQLMAFQEQVKSHQVELDRVLRKHEGEEQQASVKDTLTSSAATFENSAIAKALTDPAGSEMDIARAKAVRSELATKVMGMTPIAQNEFLSTGESTSRIKVLSQFMSAGRDLDAKAYFDAHTNQFLGDDLRKARDMVVEGSALGQAQRNATKIFSGSFSMDQDGVATMTEGAKTLGEAEAAARASSEDPKVQKYTVDEVDRRWAEMQRDKEQQRKATQRNIAQVLEKSGGDLPTAIQSNPQGWLDLDQSARDEIRKSAKLILENRNPETEGSIYADLYRGLKNPQTALKYAQIDLNADAYYKNSLSSDTRKELTKLQGEVLHEQMTPTGQAKMLFEGEIKDSVDKSPFLFSKSEKFTDEDKQRYGQILHALQQDYDAKRLSLGGTRELDDNERKALIAQRLGDTVTVDSWRGVPGRTMNFGNYKIPRAMVLRDDKIVTEPGLFWDTNKRGWELGPLPANPEIKAPPVQSPIDRVTWSRLISDQGRPVTEDKMRRIQEIWTLHKDNPATNRKAMDDIVKIARE